MSAAVEAIRAAGGTRIDGPGAFVGGLRRAWRLTRTLALLEFRLRFFGSVLGYLWQLMRPAMLFAIYYVIFTQFVPVSAGVDFFAPTLLFGIMLYQFFGEATGGAVPSVLTRENLVRKIHFPRIAIPMSVVAMSILNLGVNLIAVGAFIAYSGVPVRWSWFGVLPALGLLLVLVCGLALLLSALFVRFRDIQPIWDVVALAMFYGTPILYPLEAVKIEWARQLLMFNPLGVVIQQIRHSMFDPGAASPAEAIGGWGLLMIPIGAVFALFFLGLWVFDRAAPRVAEDL